MSCKEHEVKDGAHDDLVATFLNRRSTSYQLNRRELAGIKVGRAFSIKMIRLMPVDASTRHVDCPRTLRAGVTETGAKKKSL